MSQRVTNHHTFRTLLRRKPQVCCQCRYYASPSPASLPAPPLLLKLRNDLKSAMKAKDTARLNVLRGLLADVTNAAKTPNAIKTDMQVLSLLRKRAAAAKAASNEFREAGRQDLVDKEEQQASVLDEYAGGVEMMKDEEVREAVRKCVEDVKTEKDGKASMGEVLKRLLAPGGALDGKSVEKAHVSKLVKEMAA